MIKNRKFSKFLLSIFLPVAVFLSIGFFSFGAISTALAAPEIQISPDADNAGGAFYIGKNSTFTMTTGTISGFSRSYGGGVYVADGGTFNMSGGSIYGNTAALGGSQIYNNGTFTMTGGTIGKNGTAASRSGIYNKGEMNLYGGTIYEGIYSPYANISTKMACNIQGTITLPNNESMTVEDYAGTTPSYTIVIDSTRTPSTIVTFKGSSTEPDVSKLNISGYNTSKYVVKAVKDSSGNWTVALVNNSVEFPSDWKTQVASSTYMTSTVTVSNIQNIVFPTTLNAAYTKIGTLSTGIDVYKSVYNSGYIAFYSGKKIYMPANCTQLFYGLNVEKMSFESVDTTKTTNMSQMFANCTSLLILDLSTFNMANVSTVTNMLNFGTTGALGRILTPYGNKKTVAITASSTLYDTSTDSSATGVLANSTASKTLAKKVTVTFNPYNGSAVSPSTYTRYYGERFGRSYPTTTRPEYTFEGWYTEISGGSSIDTYTLVGDTTFYAHWSSNTGGGGSGGGGTDPDPSLPSIFERRHETSQLDGKTIGEESVADLFDIFNSQLSNTFEATDVKIFSVVSPLNSSMDFEYEVLDSYGSSGGIEAVRLSNDGSRYGFLANEWIMGLYNNSLNIGFDQWYYFDSMIFSKLGEMFPNLEILDLRGLDTSLTTFSFRIPDSVRIVIVPEDGCAATLVSNNYIQFIYGDGQTAQTNIYGGAYAAGSMGQITTTIDTIISDNIPENDMNGIYGFAIISTECPEQYNDYKFVNEYCQIENEVYLCLVEYTDSFIEKFGSSGGNIYLALVSYTSPIWITQRFVDYGGFTNFPSAGNMDYADFRGLSVIPNDYVHDMAQYLEVMSISQSLILPVRYADGGVNIETNSTIYNADGTVHTFLSTGSDEDSGLEIARTKLYNVTAEDVDLYIEDKKWFDPKKNKIKLKTQISGEEE